MLRHLGIPSVSVTMGLLSVIRMPMNVTFAGRAYDDSALLSYGYAFERATRYRRPPPRVAPLADERISYDAGKIIPPARRRETTPPVVTITGARRAGDTIVFSGTATDAGGLASVRIYVNGRKVRGAGQGAWRVAVPASAVGAGETSATLTVLAKDRADNAGAATADVPLS